MADTPNTTTTLAAVMKDLRLDIEKAIPITSKFQREYPIDTQKLVGRKALVPVILTNSFPLQPDPRRTPNLPPAFFWFSKTIKH
jgi:hypothetical protein